jgi:hypothetical protein
MKRFRNQWMEFFSISIVLLIMIISNSSSYIKAESNDYDINDCNRQMVYIGMISSRVRPSEYTIDQRIFDHVKNLSHVLFEEHNKAVQSGQERKMSLLEMKIWPPILAADCISDSDSPSKGRGSNIAHRDIWDYFHRHRRTHCEEYKKKHNITEDILLIFEYDAYLGVKDAAARTIDAIRNLRTDLMYLGYCFKKNQHPRVYPKAPFCLHAYALTLTGTKKLLDLLDPCGPFADAQLFNFANDGNITWSFINDHYDRNFVDKYFNDEGIHMSGPLEYSGIFVQAKYDDIPTSRLFHNGALSHNRLKPRQIYCLWQGVWRPVANMDDYLKLNPKMKKILLLSPWQFNKMPTADDKPLTSTEIEEILAYRLHQQIEAQQSQQRDLSLNSNANSVLGSSSSSSSSAHHTSRN